MRPSFGELYRFLRAGQAYPGVSRDIDGEHRLLGSNRKEVRQWMRAQRNHGVGWTKQLAKRSYDGKQSGVTGRGARRSY